MRKPSSTSRPPRLNLACLAALLAILSACSKPTDKTTWSSVGQGAAGGRESFILLVVDTLRVDRLGVYGSKRGLTPAVDELAARSIVYTNTFAQSSWTKTSMASLLTGLSPSKHLVLGEWRRGYLRPELSTLAEAFQAQGYVTTALVGNPHISPSTGFDQGFSTFFSDVNWFDNTTDEIAASITETLSRLSRTDQSFFLYVHFLNPHDPWKRSDGCDHLFGAFAPTQSALLNGEAVEFSGEAELEGKDLLSEVTPIPATMSAEEHAYLENLYDCEVLGVDAAIGKLLADLESLGLAGTTNVVLTADHGEEFFDHGLLRHGYQLYNETTRVPLIVHLPSRDGTHGTVEEDPVALLDVYPTLVDLADLDIHPGDGRPLPATVPGESGRDDESEPIWGTTRFRNQDEVFIIGSGHKMIWDARESTYLLFDLENDPQEKTPISLEESPVGPALRSQLDRIVASLDAAVAATRNPLSERPTKLSEEERRALRALGYIE